MSMGLHDFQLLGMVHSTYQTTVSVQLPVLLNSKIAHLSRTDVLMYNCGILYDVSRHAVYCS